MTRRIALAVVHSAIFATLGIALFACRSADRGQSAEERRRSGSLVFNLASEPTSLDPARATRLADLRVIGQCLEGLVRVDTSGQPAGAAAESWDSSPDGRTYRFHLRPAQWSNGEPVRSSDFAFAWRRVLDPAIRPYWADLFFAIEGAHDYYRAAPQKRDAIRLGIETPDERTLVVRLARPVPYFLSLVALESFYPLYQASVERLGEGAFRAPDYICNGPFRLVEHIPRRRIILEPNPLYRARADSALNRLVFVMVENEFTEWTAYRRGEIDITDSVHRSVVAAMRGSGDFHSAPLVGTLYLTFNCRRPPFDRPEVRRAFALALDRRRLVEHITRGGERPATGFVPPGIPSRPRVGPFASLSYGTDFRADGGDLVPPSALGDDEWKRIVGALPPLSRPIIYSHDASELQRSLAVAFQMMWRDKLGIEVEIRSFPSRLLHLNKRRGDYMIATASWVADYLDPTTFLDIFRTDSPNNYSQWSDVRYDQLLNRAATTFNTAERADLLHQAERLLIEQMPMCPIHFYAVTYLQRPGLGGIERNLLGRIDFSRAHWIGR